MTLTHALPIQVHPTGLVKPIVRWMKGDVCCQVTHLGSDEGGGELFKLHRGRVVTAERRTCRVLFNGESRERRVKASSLYIPPPGRDTTIRVGGPANGDGEPDATSKIGGDYPDVGGLAAAVSPEVVPDEVLDVECESTPAERASKPQEHKPQRTPKMKHARHRQFDHSQPRHAKPAVAEPSSHDELEDDEDESPDSALPDIAPARMDEALGALDTWLELGQDMAPALRLKRKQILDGIERGRRMLKQIDKALYLLTGEGGEKEPEPTVRKRDADRASHVRDVILSVLSVHDSGLTAGEIAKYSKEHDATIDRYEVHNALPRMHERNEVSRTGQRGSMRYFPPPGG